MEYCSLGRSGLKVSRLVLGTMNFGNHTDEATSFAVLDQALAAGINLIDSANVYGGKKFEGVTETLLGKWLAQGGGRREKIILATKAYGRMGEGPNDRRLSAFHLRRACDESLRRLRTDHIDIYQMHHIDRETPWEEIWQALEQLVREGKVLYVGSSNFAGWQIAHAQGMAKARHFMGLCSEQSLYNLIERTVELEVIPACRELGLGFFPWSPLAGGLLSGLKNRTHGQRSVTVKDFDKHQAKLESFQTFCEDMGEEPSEVALAWLLHNPVVTAPIIGPRTEDQLQKSLRALEIKLNAEDLEWLNTLWPGPGGEAPEAYAW